ncbi:Dockerin type I repeat protein [Novipirellula aureliae]|uniref:Dockerin type I repeat protein n=1 Tax=Novipirellula aureliae TaxID=2527966 RepID=A0A5C6E490_9BACT|nr:dockerin type I domain-containing protein [Novipirellula aureliae]TWU43304.1 Dockerin type I repeat protein [Novipirellula aureliae]
MSRSRRKRRGIQILESRIPLAVTMGLLLVDEIASIETLDAHFAEPAAKGSLQVVGSDVTDLPKTVRVSIDNALGPVGPFTEGVPSEDEQLKLGDDEGKPKLWIGETSIPIPLTTANNFIRPSEATSISLVYGMNTEGRPAFVEVDSANYQVGEVQLLKPPDHSVDNEPFFGEIVAHRLAGDGSGEVVLTVLYSQGDDSLLGNWSLSTRDFRRELGVADGFDIASSTGVTIAGSADGADLFFDSFHAASLLNANVGEFGDFEMLLQQNDVNLSDFGLSDLLTASKVASDGLTELYIGGQAITHDEQIVTYLFYSVDSTPFTNTRDRFDVNADGEVTALDALVGINYLEDLKARTLGLDSQAAKPFLDVNGDMQHTALDALQVINHLSVQRVDPLNSVLPNQQSIVHQPIALVSVGVQQQVFHSQRDSYFNVLGTGKEYEGERHGLF